MLGYMLSVSVGQSKLLLPSLLSGELQGDIDFLFLDSDVTTGDLDLTSALLSFVNFTSFDIKESIEKHPSFFAFSIVLFICFLLLLFLIFITAATNSKNLQEC